jgi:hypothetical protein
MKWDSKLFCYGVENLIVHAMYGPFGPGRDEVGLGHSAENCGGAKVFLLLGEQSSMRMF